MLDISTFGTVAGIAVVVGVLIQLLKTQLPPTYLPYVPWIAMGVGIILTLLYGVYTGQTTTAALAGLALTGIAGGLAAVAGYQATWDMAKSTGLVSPGLPPGPRSVPPRPPAA